MVSPDGQQEVEDELREAEGEQHRGLVHGAPLHSRQLSPLEYQAAARAHLLDSLIAQQMFRLPYQTIQYYCPFKLISQWEHSFGLHSRGNVDFICTKNGEFFL